MYDKEKALEKIIELMADGESLRSICKRDNMPNKSTVLRWCADDSVFATSIARAREGLIEYYTDDMVDKARDCPADSEEIQRLKLEIDTIKWIASKLKPKKYGDAMTLKGDADNPLVPLIKDDV